MTIERGPLALTLGLALVPISFFGVLLWVRSPRTSEVPPPPVQSMPQPVAVKPAPPPVTPKTPEQLEAERIATLRASLPKWMQSRLASDLTNLGSTRLSVGDVGTLRFLKRDPECVQVIDDKTFLAALQYGDGETETVLIAGIPTEDMIDGRDYSVHGFAFAVSSTTYNTAIGGTRKVILLVAQPVDVFYEVRNYLEAKALAANYKREKHVEAEAVDDRPQQANPRLGKRGRQPNP